MESNRKQTVIMKKNKAGQERANIWEFTIRLKLPNLIGKDLIITRIYNQNF